MLGLLKKEVNKRKLSKLELVNFILDQEEHRWIRSEGYVNAHFTDFLERLPLRTLEEVFIKKMTLFVRSSGKFACSVTPLQQNVVIVFPELYTLLSKTYDGWAKAVLAHEIGHIILNHTENHEDPMEAQVDADKFACDMGYLEELESFLHEQPESVEKRVRLSFITGCYFGHTEY